MRSVSFESNVGQVNPDVQLMARARGAVLYLTKDETVLSLAPPVECSSRAVGRACSPVGEPSVLRMSLGGSLRPSKLSGIDRLAGTANYFYGRDPKAWRTGIPTWARARAEDVYPGIDVVYYSASGQLEYDFIVAPGVDPGQIRIVFEGSSHIELDGAGDLIFRLPGGVVRQERPRIYQSGPDSAREIEGSYVILAPNEVGFQVAAHDPERELLIDPVLAYSTYLGGIDASQAQGVATDAAGNAYVTGYTQSTNFPTKAPYQAAQGGLWDAFVTKLSKDGTMLVYSTYLGGSGLDEGHAIAVDSAGNAYVAGSTTSASFPLQNALQPTYGGAGAAAHGDAFVTKLNASGSTILYSTYFGGSSDDIAYGIAVDPMGNVYFAGATESTNFPVKSPVQSMLGGGSGSEGFVAKLGPQGNNLVYSTYLGGSTLVDAAYGVAADSAGNAYVTGESSSVELPVKNAFQPAPGGLTDAFVTKLGATGSLVYSTFLGGKLDDEGHGIAVDASGSAHVTGDTFSGDFPSKSPFQKQRAGSALDPRRDAFVSKLAPDGASLVYSSYMGGSYTDVGAAIALDPFGAAHVVGTTHSVDFPVFDAIHPLPAGGNLVDAFVARIAPSGLLLNATYLGGTDDDEGTAIAAGGEGDAYVTGKTSSTSFDVVKPFQATKKGFNDAFVSKVVYPNAAALASIQPNRGGDTGFVSVVVRGTAFAEGATVKLARTGELDVPGIGAQVGKGGSAIGTTFDLRLRANGKWDVVVQNPQGPPIVLPGAFTIEAGREPVVWVDILGPQAARAEIEQTFTILVGHTGNIDAFGVPFWITGMPKDSIIAYAFDIVDPARPETVDPSDWDDIEIEILTDSDRRTGFVIPRVPPQVTVLFTIKITLSVAVDWQLNAKAAEPLVVTPPVPDEHASAEDPYWVLINKNVLCIMATASLLIGAAEGFVPGATCLHKATLYLAGSDLDLGASALELQEGHTPVLPLAKVLVGGGALAAECLAHESPVGKILKIGETVVGLIDTIHCFAGLAGAEMELRKSWDPNDKVGPAGGGPARALSDNRPLTYQIFFENLEMASAPAQTVVVTDPIDGDVDLDTLAFGPITIADRVLVPESGSQEVSAYFDLRDTQSLVVRVDAEVEIASRTLRWTFSSIDPDTGEPPSDSLAGFLPPNKSPPEGEGSVVFTVRPTAGLSTGATIDNTAQIVFDNNPAIATPQWSNVLDFDRPTAHLDALPGQSPPSFTVSWSGTDEGSGILDYSVLVAKDDEPYTLLLGGTTDTEAAFTGEVGSTYRFQVTARDQAGNISAPAEIDPIEIITATGCTCRVDSGDHGTTRGVPIFLVGAALATRLRSRRTARSKQSV